jgi:type 1 glutamine amidotransferase
MHPDEGDSSVGVLAGHPITDGVHSFAVFDEMYSWLRVHADVRVLATHEYEGIEHPLAWAHEFDGARVVYDALGHTPGSFESADHARLLQNAARWVLREI